MEVQPDFKELLELLNKHQVEYLIVGGYALAFHGAPRATGDLDIWIRPLVENARRLLSALADFGFKSLDLSEADLTSPGYVVQLGVPPVRVDLLTSISGVEWESADRHRQIGSLAGLAVGFIGRHDFITNKRATGRTQDLADIEALGG